MQRIDTLDEAKQYISGFSGRKKTGTEAAVLGELEHCERIADLYNEKKLLIRTRIYLTEYFIRHNDLQKALDLALSNRKMAETEGLREEELNCFSGLLQIYYLLGDYSSLEEMIQIYREKLADSNDLNKLCSLYIISAIQHYALKNYTQCMDANEQALEYALKINNPVLLVHVYNNYGFHAIHVDLDLAHRMLTRCIEQLNLTGSPANYNGLAIAYSNLAEIYFRKKDYRTCNKHLDTAIRYIKSINNRSLLLETQNRLSDLFIQTGKFSAAAKLLEKIRDECLATNNRAILLNCYQHFHQLFSTSGDYEQAYTYLLKYQELKEELFNEESNQKIRNLQIANETSNIKRQRDHAERIAHLKHDFLANMSHEIRTPINSVLGICYLLQQEPLSAKQLDYLQRLEHSGKNLLGLINEILDISKIEAGKLELMQDHFSFADVLRQACSSVQPKADEKRIEFKLEYSPELEQALVGDPLRLSQVLLNLLSNAIKFTDKGFVKVSALVQEQKEDSLLIRCRIEDSGMGIPEEKIKSIFERYEQAAADIRTQFGGTGLGLAISSRLVELMKGSIHVESKVGIGSVFTLLLPFRSSEQKLSQESVVHVDPAFLNALHIIIADDIEENRCITRDVLLHFNSSLKIAEAANGYEVLKLIEEQMPELILMDLDMPGINGFDTMKAIRANPNIRQPRIIAHTAGLLSLEKQEILDMGFDELITKPFRPQDLLIKIYEVMK